MRKFKILILSAVFLSTTACEEKEYKEDEVNTVDKKSSIETELSVQHSNTTDILITKHKIWKNNRLYKEVIKKDTIPALGDSLQTLEDESGNLRTTYVKKDYEFYITVQ